MDINILNLIVSLVISLITAIIAVCIAWGKFTQGLKDLKERFNKVEVKVDRLGERMANIEGRMGVGYTSPSSPVHLTEKGEKVLIESKAKEILDKKENREKVLDRIKAESRPNTAYDVQEKTKQAIRELADDQMFIPVKDYAFRQGVDLSIILDIVAIYFRDIALKKLGFKIEDLNNK